MAADNIMEKKRMTERRRNKPKAISLQMLLW
jgi:hypothetical protein